MFLVFTLFVFGISIGSFLNVLIDRLPQERSINGRSMCDHCRHKLAWYDLVPLVSFFLLKGKCRYCKHKIPSVLPVIELLTGVLFIFSWFYLPGESIIAKVLYLGITSCLIVIFFADIKYQIIPDTIQIALLIFIFGLFLTQSVSLQFLLTRFLSGFIVMTPILLLFLLTRGGGMGFGDVKLAFSIGLLLGSLGGLVALYFAFVIGAIAGMFLIIAGRKKLKSSIAFGPFLVIGIVTMLFWQDKIFSFLNKFYGIQKF